MLDAMRDRNMVPEPRDWKDWRARVANMEAVGGHGHFVDVWDLPGGQTYRVTGRHQMAGGLVLMFEDISTEVLRGRRYRASLALCQGVIDRMEEAIAVFAVSGQMVLSNSAYATLWGHDPGAGMAQVDLGQVLVHWQSRSAPSALWSELEDFVGLTEARLPWQGEARLHDGRLLRCRCEPLTEGATLVGFQVVPAEGPRRAISAESA
jgi:PAS domain-containing protein